MHATIHGERTLTELDFARLNKLPRLNLPPSLADLLDCAEVTSSRAVPGNIVTMCSRVEIVDVRMRRRQTLTICYPEDARPAAGAWEHAIARRSPTEGNASEKKITPAPPPLPAHPTERSTYSASSG